MSLPLVERQRFFHTAMANTRDTSCRSFSLMLSHAARCPGVPTGLACDGSRDGDDS